METWDVWISEYSPSQSCLLFYRKTQIGQNCTQEIGVLDSKIDSFNLTNTTVCCYPIGNCYMGAIFCIVVLKNYGSRLWSTHSITTWLYDEFLGHHGYFLTPWDNNTRYENYIRQKIFTFRDFSRGLLRFNKWGTFSIPVSSSLTDNRKQCISGGLTTKLYNILRIVSGNKKTTAMVTGKTDV